MSVLVDDPPDDSNKRKIGYAHVIVVNVEAGVTLADLTDTATGDWVDVVRPLGAHSDGPIGVTTEDNVPARTSLLVLDRVWIEPDYRGNELGPVIACCAILRLGRGCQLAACYPAPFEAAEVSEDRDDSIAALSRIWAKVGFTPWKDGVWMLDLRTTSLSDALEGLLPRTHHADC